METKSILNKPCTETEKLNFIVEYNHNQGLIIEETETELKALGYTKEELEQQEAERIAHLFLTGADVERGIYKAIGKDFEDVLAMVEALKQVQGDGLSIDVKALKIELKANNFYRGNPYVDAVGALLGFTKEMLDKFFADGNYKHLCAECDGETEEENE